MPPQTINIDHLSIQPVLSAVTELGPGTVYFQKDPTPMRQQEVGCYVFGLYNVVGTFSGLTVNLEFTPVLGANAYWELVQSWNPLSQPMLVAPCSESGYYRLNVTAFAGGDQFDVWATIGNGSASSGSGGGGGPTADVTIVGASATVPVSIAAPVVAKIEDSSGNVLDSDGSGALKVAVVSGGGSNPSVGLTGTSPPTSATEIGFVSGGNLVVPSSSTPLPVTVISGGGSPDVNLIEVAGSAIALGQTTMSASLPVVIASNQSALPVTGTFFQATQPVSLASTTITGSVAVTGTFFQATQPVSGAISFTAPQHVIVDSATLGTVAVSGTVAFSNTTVAVTNAGTFAVQATLSAETTKVIGTVNQGTSPWVTSFSAPQHVIVDSGGGGGVQFTDQTNETAGAFTGTVAMGYNGTQVVALRQDASNNLLTKINVALPAGSNVIGHVITDSGSTTAVTGSITAAGNLSNNNAPPSNNNFGVLPAIAMSTSPTYTAGDQVLLTTDLAGNLMVNQGETWQITPLPAATTTVFTSSTVLNTVLVSPDISTLGGSTTVVYLNQVGSILGGGGCVFEISFDGGTYIPLSGVDVQTGEPHGSAFTFTGGTRKAFRFNTAAAVFLRVRLNPVFTGSGTVTATIWSVSCATAPGDSNLISVGGAPVTVTGSSLNVNVTGDPLVQYTLPATVAFPTGTLALGWDSSSIRALLTDSGGRLYVNVNGTVSVTGTVSTTPPTHASTNVDQWNGTTTDTNSGNKSAGTLRVVLATDQPQLTNKLLVTADPVTFASPQHTIIDSATLGTVTVSGTVTANAGTGSFTVAQATAANLNATVVFPSAQHVIVDSATLGTVTTAPPTHASTNVDQWNTNTVDTNSGVKSAGTLRVILATDQPQLSNKLLVTADPITFASPQAVTLTSTTITGTIATNADGSVSGGTAGTQSLLGGGQFLTSAPTLTNGQQAALQLDANGNLKTTASFIGTIGTVNQGTANTAANSWPVLITDGTNTLGTPLNPINVNGSGVTQPISGSISFTAPQHTIIDSATLGTVAVSGTIAFSNSTISVTNAGTFAVQATLSAETTKVIGTVNQGTSPWVVSLASTTITGTVTVQDSQYAAQGSTTSGEKGPLVQGAVTTSAPSYTTAQTSPLSLTTAGALRVDGSAATQPVSGTVTANAGSGTFNIQSNAAVNVAQWAGFSTLAGTGASGNGVPRVTVSNDSKVLLWDGSITAVVKSASIASVATDPAVVVSQHPLSQGNGLGFVMDSTGVQRTINIARFDTSSSGNSQVVALVGGTKVYVLSYKVSVNGTTNVNLQSHTTTSNTSGIDFFVANQGAVYPHNLGTWITSTVGEAIDINNSSAIHIAGYITYVQF